MTDVRGPFARLRTQDERSSRPTHVQGGYGTVPAARVDAAPAPVKVRQMTNQEAENLMRAELLQTVRALNNVTTDLAARFGGRHGAVNGVLLVRLVQLSAEGRWGYAGPVAVGSAVVENHHASQPMYVQTGDSGSAPGPGLGVQLVPAGQRRIMPVGAHALTIWGPTDGALASVQLFTGLQPFGVV